MSTATLPFNNMTNRILEQSGYSDLDLIKVADRKEISTAIKKAGFDASKSRVCIQEITDYFKKLETETKAPKESTTTRKRGNQSKQKNFYCHYDKSTATVHDRGVIINEVTKEKGYKIYDPKSYDNFRRRLAECSTNRKSKTGLLSDTLTRETLMLFGFRMVTISTDTNPLYNKEKLIYIAKEEEFKNINLMLDRAKKYLEDLADVKKEEPKLEYLADENFNAYEVTNYFNPVLASLLVKIGCRELKDICIYKSIDDLIANIKKASSNLDDDTLTEYGVTILDTMKMLKLHFREDSIPEKPVPNPADDIIPLPIKEEPVVEKKEDPKKIVSIDTKGIIGKINNLTNNIPKEKKESISEDLQDTLTNQMINDDIDKEMAYSDELQRYDSKYNEVSMENLEKMCGSDPIKDNCFDQQIEFAKQHGNNPESSLKNQSKKIKPDTKTDDISYDKFIKDSILAGMPRNKFAEALQAFITNHPDKLTSAEMSSALAFLHNASPYLGIHTNPMTGNPMPAMAPTMPYNPMAQPQQQIPKIINPMITGTCPCCSATFTVAATQTHRLYCFSCGSLIEY